MDNSVLIISRHPPYNGGKARAALDAVLAFAAFDRPVNLLLTDAGASQLIKNQHSASLGCKNHARMLSALPLYGVEKVYVESGSAKRFGLNTDNSALPFCCISDVSLIDFINRHRHVVSL